MKKSSQSILFNTLVDIYEFLVGHYSQKHGYYYYFTGLLHLKKYIFDEKDSSN